MKVNDPTSFPTQTIPRFLSCALNLPCTVSHALQEKNKKIKRFDNRQVYSFRDWDAWENSASSSWLAASKAQVNIARVVDRKKRITVLNPVRTFLTRFPKE